MLTFPGLGFFLSHSQSDFSLQALIIIMNIAVMLRMAFYCRGHSIPIKNSQWSLHLGYLSRPLETSKQLASTTSLSLCKEQLSSPLPINPVIPYYSVTHLSVLKYHSKPTEERLSSHENVTTGTAVPGLPDQTHTMGNPSLTAANILFYGIKCLRQSTIQIHIFISYSYVSYYYVQGVLKTEQKREA